MSIERTRLNKFIDSIGLDGIIFYPSPEQMKLNTYLIKTYGINLYDYHDLLKKQDGSCFICRKKVSNKRLVVDHCHKTGIVRGLLCSKCNTGLGSFGDNTDSLERAIFYLKEAYSKWGLSEKGDFKVSKGILIPTRPL